MKSKYFVGTAAWTIPKESKSKFPDAGITSSHLGRYAQVLTGVEINTSFYRHHHGRYYQKWAKETPDNFRFSVKLSKEITHVEKLSKCGWQLEQIIPPILELGEKLGCLLVQLPPTLEFETRLIKTFFQDLRSVYPRAIAIEPRHETWKQSLDLLANYRVSLVLPDPNPRLDIPIEKFGNHDIMYCRLHGSPEMYRSLYSRESLEKYFEILAASSAQQKWCVFDNTMFGHGTINALEFLELVRKENSVGDKIPPRTGQQSAQPTNFPR